MKNFIAVRDKQHTTQYFGLTLEIPRNTVAVATDANGAVFAYTDKPQADTMFPEWVGVEYKRLGTIDLDGTDWKDTLVLV